MSMTVHVSDRVGEVQVDLLGGLCLLSLLAQHPLLAASLHGEVQGLHTHTQREGGYGKGRHCSGLETLITPHWKVL